VARPGGPPVGHAPGRRPGPGAGRDGGVDPDRPGLAAPRDQPARRAPGAHLLATLEHARDTGRTTISNQTTLPGDLDLPTRQRPVAFELFVPVYGSELGQNASVAERRQFVGWAAGQFRAGDFLHAALQSTTPTTGVELHDERVGPGSLVASEPEGFRAGGPDVRETRFTSGERTFVLRYAPLAGNPILAGNTILTERTIPASLLLGACCGCWPRSAPCTGRSGGWPGPTRAPARSGSPPGTAARRRPPWSPGPTGPVRRQGGRSQPELRRPRRGRRAVAPAQG
jgi:CHASE domain